ncbi:MAG: T9SS type A sorting domain-containing protein [Ignavibacteriaceae bacterium]|nr:T9SS type A sorting domain-containing protein [Ignavibacteriaceae bacterium]
MINYLKILVIVLLLFSLNKSAAQVKIENLQKKSDGMNFSISFDEPRHSINIINEERVISFPDYLDEGSPGSPVVPYYVAYIAIPPFAKIEVKVEEKNVNSFANVRPEINKQPVLDSDSTISYKEVGFDQKYFSFERYPANQFELLGYTWIRDYYCAVIKFNFARFNWKKKEVNYFLKANVSIDYLDIKPFSVNTSPKSDFDAHLKSIILNYESAEDYRSFPKFSIEVDTSGNWIDYSKEYVKLLIHSDGIYRITYNDLIQYGVNPGSFNPKTLKIFLNGAQIPLYVSGEDDNVFNPEDYIEFWATRNYGSPDYRDIVPVGVDYLEFFNRYNDSSFVWLTWDGNNGARLNTVQQSLPGITDTLTSHITKIHLEAQTRLWYYDAVVPRVQLPFWQENKVWTWGLIGKSGNVSHSFTVNNFVPNTPLKTYVRLISNAANIVTDAHRHGVGINSSPILDTITYDFRQTVNLFSTFSSNLLVNGTNSLKVYGLQTAATFHQSLIDWVEVEYFRENIAVNDSLFILLPDSITQGNKVIKISGIIEEDSNIVFYRIKPNVERITGYNLTSGTGKVLTFSDTVKGKDAFLFIKKAYLKSPIFKVKKQFVNLRDPNREADYIIITNSVLEPSSAEYENFISSNYGLRTERIFINDIYDEFAYGLNNAEAVRDFLIAAYNNWVSPKPTYLNLLGDANYDYKNVFNTTRKNLVPSFGNPVSDSWYTMWDTSNVNIQQMLVARIPANTNEEVLFYLNKHQSYVTRGYDEFNKHYLFFSGGLPSDPGLMALIKAANDSLFEGVVKPAPIGGVGRHFYKTINPPTNFGPYTPEEIRESLDAGGSFISYIGHSGTQTWDNGINDVIDIKNAYNDRHPLISDFGCSTGKYAEPDVDAFGELFICLSTDGQAINYLGNASWGYTSTSLRFPDYFYRKILLDSTLNVSEAHFLSKVRQFNETGYSDVNRVFNYCNILFGDPIINFNLPQKPNLKIYPNSFKIIGENPNNLDDSVKIKFDLLNLGKVKGDTVQINIQDFVKDTLSFESNFTINIPLYSDEIIVSIPVKNKVGEHKLIVDADKLNLIDEIYENDNTALFNYNVYSTSVRPVEFEKYYTASRSLIKLINPVSRLEGIPETIRFEISDNDSFFNPTFLSLNFDTLYTDVNLPSLTSGKRYWYRTKIDEPLLDWSESYSFFNLQNNRSWFIGESFKNSDIIYDDVLYDSTAKSWKLKSGMNTLKIGSAGEDAGDFGSMVFNGQERLPNTFYWGIATAFIDTVTLEPHTFRYFVYGTPGQGDSLANYINSLPEGTTLALTIGSDGQQSVLGGIGSNAREKIKTLGSFYIDSVGYKDSWCIIGKKGAATGTVPEAFKDRYQGPAWINVSKLVFSDSGFVKFPVVSNATEWKSIFKSDSLPAGSEIKWIPLGLKENGTIDTLQTILFNSDSSSISFIDASLYPRIQMLAEFKANEFKQSPYLKNFGLDFTPLPELAINYQVVSTDLDSVYQGNSINLNFSFANLSYVPTDTTRVSLYLIKPDNTEKLLLDSVYFSIDSLQMKNIFYQYTSNKYDGFGNMKFRILIDADQRIKELYKDNNFFEKSFYVIRDTLASVSPSAITALFDGIDILDGDFVAPKPEVELIINYPVWFPVEDTSAIQFKVNNNLIPYHLLNSTYDSVNRTINYKYSPNLPDGENFISLYTVDNNGLMQSTPSFEKYFRVSSELKLLEVFNYPNPFKESTAFTFKLTQIPDELRIKIYSIAGRLIRNISLKASQLNYDFNRITWDGRDEDGDVVANGVYIYKVIITKSDKSESITQKLSIVR